MNLREIKNILKSFGDTKVIDDISFVFEKGKTNLIIGKSGSGKSVLTKCIVGLLTPDSGQILYDGKDMLTMSLKEKKKIRKELGMLFQGGALFDSKTIADNIAFPLMMFSNYSKSEINDRVNFCLERVDIINKNKLYPAEISGGMQKRVAIARAIAMNPKYLFCDEPNSGLDPRTAIVIDNLIQEITKEYDITTIINSHDMNSVLEIGEKIIFLENGMKKWEGTNKEIFSTKNKSITDFVYSSELLKKVKKYL
jgi:phospholipid/cholesterol/gamma-HCH transport system ATP-binding protein